MNDDFKPSE